MLFNSFNFIFLFFPLVTVIFFVLPQRFRWLWLLLASCYFYMAFVPKYILILAVTIAIDYFAGIYIEKSQGHKRKLFLIASIVANVSLLAFFKYFNFFAANVNDLAQLLHWNYPLPLLNIILPIGLSFHTFQAMSYTIEVYRKNQKAERHFGIYALYVMFFPQLVAGPIERPQNLLHQFHEEKFFDYARVVDGLQQMLLGLFKKIFIADRLATLVNGVYGQAGNFHGFTLIFATIFFAFQLYCDFSGYSDIALGSAKVLGFKLMDNFNRPYFSKSVAEFWRRWHISLMSWLRDYLYLPLVFSGRHRGRKWLFFSLITTFVISGLWHGADWKYVFMGLLNGVYIVCSQLTTNLRKFMVKFLRLNLFPAFHRILQTLMTFGLICVGWIFFRANTLGDAFYIISHLFTGLGQQLHGLLSMYQAKAGLTAILAALWPGILSVDFFIAVISILLYVIYELNQDAWSRIFSSYRLVRWSIYYSAVLLILYFGVFGQTQFIYFQF